MTLAGFLLLLFIAFVLLINVRITRSAFAQSAPLAPRQLDQLMARIALYQDPLLAQILTASTYRTVIPEAAEWADQHSYLKGDALAEAIQADHLQGDPRYLSPNGYVNVVSDGGYIQIMPVNPSLIYLPDPTGLGVCADEYMGMADNQA